MQEEINIAIIREPQKPDKEAPMRDCCYYTPGVDEFATTSAAAILFGWWMITKFFPSLLKELPDWSLRGLILIISGMMSLANPTIHHIAKRMKVSSHDTLHRCILRGGWNAAIIISSIVNYLVSSVCGMPSFGYLILDDVLCNRKGGKKLPYVYRDYDYVNSRYTLAMRIVFLIWSNGLVKIPVGFAIWHKSNSAYLLRHNLPYKSKNQLARELIQEALESHIPFEFIAFDSWYASKENLRFLLERGVKFVTCLRSNRNIRFVIRTQAEGRRGRPKRYETLKCKDLASRFPSRVSHKYPRLGGLRARGFRVNLKGVGTLRLVMVRNYANSHLDMRLSSSKRRRRDPHKYILTNMEGLSVVDVVQRYQARWDVEVLFRDLKQHFALGRYWGRSVEGAERHIALVCMGYVGVEIFRSQFLDLSYTIGEAKVELATHTFRVIGEGGKIKITPLVAMGGREWKVLFDSLRCGEGDNLGMVQSLMVKAFSKTA